MIENMETEMTEAQKRTSNTETTSIQRLLTTLDDRSIIVKLKYFNTF